MDYVWSGHGPWSDQINPPTPLAAGGASEEKLPAASARSTSNIKRVRSESEVRQYRPDESHLQDAAGNSEAGSAGRQAS